MDFEDLNAPAFTADFSQAAAPAAHRMTVPVNVDADLLAYFQSDAEPGNWQQKINDVLRFYVETSQIAEADAEAVAQQLEHADEPAPSL